MQLRLSLVILSLFYASHAADISRHARIAAAHKRQGPPAMPSAVENAASPPTVQTPSSPAAPTPVQPTPPTVPSGSASAPSAATTTTYTRDANGVMPLAGITSGMTPAPTLPVTASWAPGSVPSHIPGAPGLPESFVYVASDWPTPDKVPPTDSQEVQAWLKELEGWDIPDLNPTVNKADCGSNPTEAADAIKRGWWTCSGTVRPDIDIVACPTKFDWGLSFDDGPTPYTETLLEYLKERDIKSTFFVVGSRVVYGPRILIQEYMEGHEISVHTWSHNALTTLTNEQIVAELGWTRKVIKDVLGVTPTTMRPPYGDIDDRVRAISLAMGLNPVIWTATPNGAKFDTNDWRVADGTVTGTQSFETFQSILGNASTLDTGFIVLQHDLFPVCVDLATGHTLQAALSHNPSFSLKPIGSCMGFDSTTLYMETNKDTKFPAVPQVAATTNGTKSDGTKPGVKVDTDGDGKVDTKTSQANSNNSNNGATSFTPSGGLIVALSLAAISAIFL